MLSAFEGLRQSEAVHPSRGLSDTYRIGFRILLGPGGAHVGSDSEASNSNQPTVVGAAAIGSR
jgi:hypothetical protein